MPCYHPLRGFRGHGGTFVLKRTSACLPVEELAVPCGRCIGCRLEYSRQWAVRLMHEDLVQKESCFVTLTYNDEHLPPHGCLRKSDFQRFARKLRKIMAAEDKEFGLPKRKLRYFHCGEYGERTWRPHYHAALFGVSFPDRELHKRSRKGYPVYTSASLQRAWSREEKPMGFATLGDLTFESAAYVARYVTKKVNGPKKEEHYERCCQKCGEVYQLPQEYTTMSRRPGIGAGFLDRFADDVYPSDEVISRGRPAKPPRYYDEWLRKNRPEEYEMVKARRSAQAEERAYDNSAPRLEARERVAKARLQMTDPVREGC